MRLATELRLTVWLSRFLLRFGETADTDRGDVGGEYGESGGVPSQCRLSVWRMWCLRGTGAIISERSVSELKRTCQDLYPNTDYEEADIRVTPDTVGR